MKRLILLATAMAVLVAVPAAATAAASHMGRSDRRPAAATHWLPESYVTVPVGGASEPGGAGSVHVLEVGSPVASQVVVLIPGQFAAAGDFRVLAEALAKRLPSTQVWAVDRREQSLTDLSGFASGDPVQAAAYYLGGRYRSETGQSVPQAANWGLAVTVNDLRRVVTLARDGGRRRVVLGGHSWGAATALAYAAWDFDGKAGYRDLSGLVLMDGGVHDAFAGEGDTYRLTATDAVDGLAQIAGGEVFDPTLTMGRSETYAILQQLVGEYATAAPNAPSALAGQLPEALRPTVPVTNLGLLRWLYVTHPLVPDLSINPAYTSLTTMAKTLAGPVPAAFEWYWPQRLTLDLEANDAYRRTPATDVLGLRLWHTHDIRVPLYSFESGLTHGTVNTAARWVVANSRIQHATFDGDDAMAHVDVVFADADHNTMLHSLVPFLHSLDQH